MSIFFTYNGKFYKENEPVITPDSRALKYGDGLFETIKLDRRKLLLKQYHFERLFNGMQVLGFDTPPDYTADFFEKEIIALADKNTQYDTAVRARLTVFRGNESLTKSGNDFPNYIIQTWNIPGTTELNINGFSIDVCPGLKKSFDILSNIKTNNFLTYLTAARFAKMNKLDDCILLNSVDKVCETSIANIFIIKNKNIYTPPLTDGCIAGVMRRWILETSKNSGNSIIERSLCIEDLKEADEIFLTNSIYPIRWVKQFRDVSYNNTQIQFIYNELAKTF